MKRDSKQICWLNLSVLMAVLIGSGCNNSAPLSGQAAAPKRPGPEESFELILTTFRRLVEGIPGGFAVPNEGGHSRLIASNKVSSELIRPIKEGQPYRATVTVDSQSRFSMQHTTSEAGAADDRGNEGSEQRAALSPLDDSSGFDNLGPGLVAPSADVELGRPSPATGESIILRREDEEVHSFDLEYRDGRWVLLTKPDPETEQSIEYAFAKALATQD